MTEKPPNQRTTRCCAECGYGGYYKDGHGDGEVKCDKYDIFVAWTETCDSWVKADD